MKETHKCIGIIATWSKFYLPNHVIVTSTSGKWYNFPHCILYLSRYRKNIYDVFTLQYKCTYDRCIEMIYSTWPIMNPRRDGSIRHHLDNSIITLYFIKKYLQCVDTTELLIEKGQGLHRISHPYTHTQSDIHECYLVVAKTYPPSSSVSSMHNSDHKF